LNFEILVAGVADPGLSAILSVAALAKTEALPAPRSFCRFDKPKALSQPRGEERAKAGTGLTKAGCISVRGLA
jgi:hypothetical protein